MRNNINQRRDSDANADTIIGSNTTGNYRHYDRITASVSQIRTLDLGWDTIGDLRDDFTIERSYEFGGSSHRIEFEGSEIGACVVSDSLLSDPTVASLSKGDDVFERAKPAVADAAKAWP